PALWSLAAYLLLPYALFNLVRRGLRYPAYWSRWPERFGYGASFKGGKSIWVHAVSVGEVRSAAQLVHALGRRYPDHRLTVTTGTPTGSEQVRELFADRVSHSYVPYDLPGAVRRFMDRVKPEFAIVAETELWPNLFGECGKRGIPLFLVNVSISPDSLWRYKRVPVATNAMLANADLLCAQSRKVARQLEDLGVSRHLIHVTGNLKFDAPVEESVLAEGRKLRRQWGRQRFVLIAASTHPGEERRILAAFGRLKTRFPDLLLVVVPRHPERFTRVARLCRRTGHRVVRRTEHVGDLARDVDIVVGDTMGELQKLYAASDVAFIGGSLVEVGGHNILEACAVGVPVIFGPHMFQAQEVGAMAVERGAARCVADIARLSDAMKNFIEQPELLETSAAAARALVSDNRGALVRTLELIDGALADTPRVADQGHD
ncbi:MAG: lipid IV(A) 3-deoxy-D-manno-octulosonic acid transferase, partial [Rhodospirillaceae bacterium]|nr:lipid IV(A) 3-deoxy-D-manno-octulosonic acid transferase [Rhodospirillaceae bacterium]